jgi:DNA polymerase (family 10)
MKNQEIAKIFYEIADYLEMEGVSFKPYAYQKAAIVLETLEEDAKDVYEKGGLEGLKKIPGVGESIALRIEEYLKTGKIKYYEDFKKKLPIKLEEIIAVYGMGPKKARVLYEKLKIKNLKDLEKAARSRKIASLPGFGEKTEKNILESINFLKRSKGRFLLGDILPKVSEFHEKLKSLKEVDKINVAGSVRRMKETIGDVDFLVISKNPKTVMDFFTALPGVIKIWGKGETKSSVRLREGFDMDIRVLPRKSYGAALQYFTGSKEHNIALRKIAINKGLKLSEYGLFRGPKNIASADEEDIYKKLGMAWIPPEMREDNGEIEAALRQAQGKPGSLPKIIGYGDIKGDLHVHCDWNGGSNSIEQISQAAIKMGYDYVGISDHTKFLHIEHGLDEKQLERRNREIDKINEKLSAAGVELRVLKGCEANIMADGSIDIKDYALAKLDFVIAGVHSQLKIPREKMTQRLIRAMKNPHVDIISHPTGRLIGKRDEYQIDFDEILKAARDTKTVLEINSYPERLDLKDVNIKKAKVAGVKMVINTDAHHIDQLKFIKYGIAQARRGWAEKKDIINCSPAEKMLKMMK